MNVYISFEPDGRNGLVAGGTFLWDAAKRLGVTMPSYCESRAECDECALIIKEGMGSLSPVTDVERAKLGEERLQAGERLACQAKIIGPDDVIIEVPQEKKPEEDAWTQFGKEFGKMPLDKKYATLTELEQAVLMQKQASKIASIHNTAASIAFRKEFDEMSMAEKLAKLAQLESAASVSTALSVLNLPWTIGEKVLDLIAVQGKKIHIQEKEDRHAQDTRTEERSEKKVEDESQKTKDKKRKTKDKKQ
jgi:ferredoxin